MQAEKDSIEMGRTEVSAEMIAAYRADGFVKVPNLLTPACAARFREKAFPVATGRNRRGDGTFHNGFTGHMATPNQTDDWRIAHVTIYMQDGATYSGKRHVVTDSYKEQIAALNPGDPLTGKWFPRPNGEEMPAWEPVGLGPVGPPL